LLLPVVAVSNIDCVEETVCGYRFHGGSGNGNIHGAASNDAICGAVNLIMQYHVIDVFTEKPFGGNPAGVCLLDKWLPDGILQSIAAENNLSETAFLVKQDGYYDLRWFSPLIEVDLCGHATLASAFVLFEEAEKAVSTIKFKTMSGMMAVEKENDLLYLDFPARPVVVCPMYQIFEKAFGVEPIATYKAVDFLILLDNEETLQSITPNFAVLRQIKTEAKINNDSFGVIVTAEGNDCDFVSRFFAPNAGIDEDPVTGRAHCSLIPFWSEKLGKSKLIARQLSKRGGVLFCESRGERVRIGGNAVRYLRGEIGMCGFNVLVDFCEGRHVEDGNCLIGAG